MDEPRYSRETVEDELPSIDMTGRRALAPLLGWIVALAMLILAVGICSLQFQDVSTLTISAQAGRVTDVAVPYEYISYTAKIADNIVEVGGRPVVLEDNPAEFVCNNGRIEARAWRGRHNRSGFNFNVRLYNNCDSPVSIQICWFNATSLFRVLATPSCGG